MWTFSPGHPAADTAHGSQWEAGNSFSVFFFLLPWTQSEEAGRGCCSLEALLICSSTLQVIFSCLDGDGMAGISPWKITPVLSLSFFGKWPPGC